ncbi:GNAT family N-acetyltransferase [Noviherbaspirillum autotrophicum]|uniref:N-acetyltransferase domain-containing protein n=1 Tax=Noviherbaspirillum autotrophicum TaxID=709839 RepID=A0A0C2BN37_9BURK|nr:hypothetical protein [Noviherbaspirillum autotrophicum]KIF81404.1 hypothetical protein TSA66_12210 [Noviherbaspirillum autotrophicum]
MTVEPIASASLRQRLGEGWDAEITGQSGDVLGHLRVLGPDDEDVQDINATLVTTLCAWRNQYAQYFFDSSEVTPASTMHWLQGLMRSTDRLFFVVSDPDGRLVAQYGLREISAGIVELDNGILGVRGGSPDLYLRIQQKILGLCKTKLGYAFARAQVLADNLPALFLHKRCGLRLVQKISGAQSPAGRDVFVMEIALRDTCSY